MGLEVIVSPVEMIVVQKVDNHLQDLIDDDEQLKTAAEDVLREKGCLAFKHSYQYDINTSQRVLVTFGYARP